MQDNPKIIEKISTSKEQNIEIVLDVPNYNWVTLHKGHYSISSHPGLRCICTLGDAKWKLQLKFILKIGICFCI